MFFVRLPGRHPTGKCQMARTGHARGPAVMPTADGSPRKLHAGAASLVRYDGP